ncbi:cell wall metabolism sensor histidine kinase WalK [Schleiferilactobacillus perolens]|jgi:two-component system sensor histidine kinase VicK|uniref:cell wall metabolism sensor histidine kinase WalK n=1 Tax=Schleiferilactobacillus perolens TaxID=100468 RepID=UPI002353F979|nr:cell wall metabolism sensor histidine kinase WalK [Schleiferilactobacillus perolens]MCI1892444.1 cell wall metabolism sensor histidine kinase WalK [Schleiferilactobacillus harbinensis]MCI1913500.1 cell wall metabolism sensor histidine kinase WalK [Schleiferilactobacillus harbinensis]MCI2170972.1 cell wall metabolism sensor histidine kinase WalK [Schleiferilactobacillus perolens]
MNKRIKLFQSIHFKIALVFVLLLVVTLEVIGAYFVGQLQEQNISTFEDSIQLESYVTSQLSTALVNKDTTQANQTIKDIIANVNKSNISEIQVIDNRGIIRGTSNVNDQDAVGRRSTDQDVKKGIYNNRKLERISQDNRNQNYYVSITPLSNPTAESNATVGVVYVRANMEPVFDNITKIVQIFLAASLVAAVMGTLIAILISRAITKPIDDMKKQAIRMARGDYSGQVRIYGNDELGQLAVAVNNLSVRVEEAQEASEAERRRLDSVLSYMTDGVIATDRRGNVVIINDTAQDYLGKTEEETIGRSILDVLAISEDYTLRDLLEKQQEIILDMSDRSDKDLILHAYFSLIQRETGFISGLVCVLHDVTEQEKNEREQQQFVSNVSHELRTPLTSLRSYIEALNDGAWKDPKIAPKFLKVTQEETERMIRMINDLLSLSRIDRGTAKLDLEYVNLNEFLVYIINRFDMMIHSDEEHAEDSGAPKKHYVIKRDLTKQDIWLEIDTDKMTQVIDNIMNNAIKYSPDGGTITVRLFRSREHVLISIADQGLGIPRADLAKVFDRFYRVDKARSRKQGGTGLGLAISKEVVEAHHGRIWVNSTEGKGSTFYISLPYQPYDPGGDWDDETV